MSNKYIIPLTVKNTVWGTYIGENNNSHCFCCTIEPITKTNFVCGHTINKENKERMNIKNLRPICSLCKKSIGNSNMELFMEKYGYQKCKNWNGITIIVNEGTSLLAENSLIYDLCNEIDKTKLENKKLFDENKILNLKLDDQIIKNKELLSDIQKLMMINSGIQAINLKYHDILKSLNSS